MRRRHAADRESLQQSIDEIRQSLAATVEARGSYCTREDLAGLASKTELQVQEVVTLNQRHRALVTQVDQHHTGINNLRGEFENLAMLPRVHPRRLALIDELMPRFRPILDQLHPVLFPTQLPLDDLDWMYKLPDRKFPYSLTFEEGMMLHHLVHQAGLANGYEIATAFGFSSFFIASALQKNGGHLVSVDAYIEEEMEDYLYDLKTTQEHVAKLTQAKIEGRVDALPRGLQFAMDGAVTLGIKDTVDYRIACSPEGIPEQLAGQTIDFAFIDGGHFGEQPVWDVRSVVPYLHPDRFVIAFHDTQCEAVAKGVHAAAEATGCEPFSIHTRNRLVVVCRGVDPAILQGCRNMTLRQFV